MACTHKLRRLRAVTVNKRRECGRDCPRHAAPSHPTHFLAKPKPKGELGETPILNPLSRAFRAQSVVPPTKMEDSYAQLFLEPHLTP